PNDLELGSGSRSQVPAGLQGRPSKTPQYPPGRKMAAHAHGAPPCAFREAGCGAMKSYHTSTNPDLERQARSTPPGMAHWAGTRPVGATCKGFVFFGDIPRENGPTRHNRCKQYRTLTGEIGGCIRGDTPACRHFQARP